MGLFEFGFSIIFGIRADFPLFLVFIPFVALGAYIITSAFTSDISINVKEGMQP